MDNIEMRIQMGDLDKKMWPFLNERVLADCRATLYFYAIDADNKCFLKQLDEEIEPVPAKPDNGATDYIKKTKVYVPENDPKLLASINDSQPEFSILKD